MATRKSKSKTAQKAMRKRARHAHPWLLGGKLKLVMMPLFFGILTYLITVPLININLALAWSAESSFIALNEVTGLILSAMGWVLPLVAAMLLGAKFARVCDDIGSIGAAISSFVLVLVYLLPFVVFYGQAGRLFDLGWWAGETLFVYMVALIGYYIGHKAACTR